MRATLICLLLAGCAASAPPAPAPQWVKLNPGAEDGQMAWAKCRMEQAKIAPPAESNDHSASGNLAMASAYLADASMREQFMGDCMLTKGWAKR